jgi:hypothetical protein
MVFVVNDLPGKIIYPDALVVDESPIIVTRGRPRGLNPPVSAAERKRRQRAKEAAADAETERLRLAAEAKAALIAAYNSGRIPLRRPKDHTGYLQTMQRTNWEIKVVNDKPGRERWDVDDVDAEKKLDDAAKKREKADDIDDLDDTDVDDVDNIDELADAAEKRESDFAVDSQLKRYQFGARVADIKRAARFDDNVIVRKIWKRGKKIYKLRPPRCCLQVALVPRVVSKLQRPPWWAPTPAPTVGEGQERSVRLGGGGGGLSCQR